MSKFKSFTTPLRWFPALLLVALAAGCNSGSDPILGGSGGGENAPIVVDTTAPTIIRVSVQDGTVGLMPINQDITATFSEAMDPATLISASPSTAEGTTFTVCSTATEGGVCVDLVAGVVSDTNNTTAFNPDGDLVEGTWYKSTITASATDLAGNALLVPPAVGSLPNPWNWQTGPADLVAPTITLTNPADLATDVPLNKTIHATFSEEMRQATITDTNYKVMETATQVDVPGTVSYDVLHHIASFVPSSNLSLNTDYTVTVSDAVEDLAGNALVVPAVGSPSNPWTFRTGEAVEEPQALAINLGVAESFGIASRAGLTTTGVTVVNGDIALYPEASCTDATGNAGASQTCLVKTYESSTGMTVNGSIYWAGDPYDDGATALAVTNDLNAAWVEGKNKEDTFAPGSLGGELGASGASDPDGKTLLPGVYHEDALGLAAGNVVTFDAEGDPNAIFIIKIDSSFVDSGIEGNETEVKLANGAQARNIWFIAGLDITIGHGTTWYGNILAGRTATINDGSAVNGRVLAGASGAGAITLTGAASPSVTSISVPQ